MNMQVAVSNASSSNPGVPPSSLFSFLRIKPTLPGLVLSDFDAQLRNHLYESEADSLHNVQTDSLVAAAILTARALHDLAVAGGQPALQVGMISLWS